MSTSKKRAMRTGKLIVEAVVHAPTTAEVTFEVPMLDIPKQKITHASHTCFQIKNAFQKHSSIKIA